MRMPDQSLVRWKAIALSLFPLPIALGLTMVVYFDSMSAGSVFDDPFDLRHAGGANRTLMPAVFRPSPKYMVARALRPAVFSAKEHQGKPFL